MTRAISLSLGVAMVALFVPADAPAQNANTRPANINRSANLKSGIFRGSGNFIQRNSRASFIGGGQSNRIFFGVDNAVIGGGFGNFVAGQFSVAGGGLRNFVTNNSRASSIGGGAFNIVDATDSVLVPAVEGGIAAATIAGGFSNTVRGRHAFVGGGSLNTAGGDGAVIGGGGFNNIDTNTFSSVIAGGEDNSIRTGASSSVIGGGVYNEITASSAVIGGGGTNGAAGEGGTVAGGGNNDAYGFFSSIGGGQSNDISTAGVLGVIGGGLSNMVNGGSHATIGGGSHNLINGHEAVIGGGLRNSAGGNNSTVAGGHGNTADAFRSSIGGGFTNKIAQLANGAVIGGGVSNTITATATNATIPGGNGNEVSGEGSFAAGVDAEANHRRSFVWGDGSTTTSSLGTNTFTVRASGGVKFFSSSSSANINGPILAPNATDWQAVSDSNLKTGVTAVDYRAVLAKLAAMPVTTWQFKHDKGRRYIGPMAQDFHAFFGLGSSDTTIGTLDADGVLFSSVKGLVEELKERDKEIAELKKKSAEIDLLKKKLDMVEERLGLLPPSP